MAKRRGGYIKLFRDLRSNKLWSGSEPFDQRSAWVDLLLRASHRDDVEIAGWTRVALRPGEVVVSKRSLASDWRWSRGRLDRFLTYLAEEGMIEQRSIPSGGPGRKATVITVLNWAVFQVLRATKTAYNSEEDGDLSEASLLDGATSGPPTGPLADHSPSENRAINEATGGATQQTEDGGVIGSAEPLAGPPTRPLAGHSPSEIRAENGAISRSRRREEDETLNGRESESSCLSKEVLNGAGEDLVVGSSLRSRGDVAERAGELRGCLDLYNLMSGASAVVTPILLRRYLRLFDRWRDPLKVLDVVKGLISEPEGWARGRGLGLDYAFRDVETAERYALIARDNWESGGWDRVLETRRRQARAKEEARG